MGWTLQNSNPTPKGLRIFRRAETRLLGCGLLPRVSACVVAVVSAWGFSAQSAPSVNKPMVALTPELDLRVRPDKAPSPPKTPKGLQPCQSPLAPVGDLPRIEGETIRYLVNVDGVSVGTIDFKIEKRGTYEGRKVTEYRSLFKLDSLVSTVVPLEGRAAALVAEESFWPLRAMSRYDLNRRRYEEEQDYGAGGRSVAAKRTRNGKKRDQKRSFPGPAQDFVTGFYYLRRLPIDAAGCAIIYGHHRAYTVWIHPDGSERVATPIGLKMARRYKIRYGSDKSKRFREAKVWLGDTTNRLPFKAEINGKHHLEATIHLFEAGQSP